MYCSINCFNVKYFLTQYIPVSNEVNIMIVAGIDYSMTCPGVCIYNTDKDLQFKNCDHFFMAPSKKY